MLISVSELMKLEDSEKPISVDVDLSDVSFMPMPVSFSSIHVEGKLKNSGGVILLESVATGTYETVCDRCGAKMQETIQFDVCENFVKSTADLDSDSDAVVLVSQAFDLKKTVSQFAFSSLPYKHICKEDCKGLCSACGKNLNFETCTCKEDEWNPQFEVLKGLFD